MNNGNGHKLIDPHTTYIAKNGNGNGNGQAHVYPSTVPDKLQPHNVEAEEAVLGSLLIDSDAIIRVDTFLEPDDFYIERHSWIFEVIKDLYERREPADMVTLTDELERRGQLKEIGGAPYLSGLINATPTSIHAEYYARIIERTAVSRRLIGAAGEIAKLGYSDTDGIDDVVDKAESFIFNVIRKHKNGGPEHIKSGLRKVQDNVDRIQQNPGTIVGIPTGLSGLDKLMCGLQKSDMVTLAGRPGMGKTSLALAVALNAAKKWGKRVAIFSLEMSDEQLTQKMIAAVSGIDSQRIRMANIKEDEWPVYFQAINTLALLPIFIDDTPAISSFELRSRVRRLATESGTDLVILDYLQLMRGDTKSENRQQEVSYISRNIKALAKEIDIPILALSQLSRACESRTDKRPMLSDLRESGSIEQDSDEVIFLYRDDVYNPDTEFPNVTEINLEKNRHGPTGVSSVYFQKHLTKFIDLEINVQSLGY